MINFKLILDSILSPKLVFQKVLNYEIKPSVLIEAVLFICIINALFTYTSNYLIYSNSQFEESIFMGSTSSLGTEYKANSVSP